MSEQIQDDSDRLKSCPFCDADAELVTVPNDHPDAGAMFAQCTNSMCMASSCLIYPCGDDPTPLLLEKWNRRPIKETDTTSAQAAEIERLKAECEALKTDAERYRWLRNEYWMTNGMVNIHTKHGADIYRVNNAGDLETLDAAIDAARRKT